MVFPLRTTIRIEDRGLLIDKMGFSDFASLMNFQGGRLVTLQRGRTVTTFDVGSRAFYLKRNRFNWKEFLKSLLHLRWPPRNALNEWYNILAVKKAGIPTVRPLAAGEKRMLGIELESFILTEELYGAQSIEKICQNRLCRPLSSADIKWKRSLIRRIAKMAKRLHQSGMCHQDFYLGHIFLGENDSLYLIDLQRVLIRNKVSRRYQVKDLGQLNFSAETLGCFSRTDRLRFFMEYLGSTSLTKADKKLAMKIQRKTDRIARHTERLLERRRRRKEIE